MKFLCLLLAVLATPAGAAERRYDATDFDRIRVEGPFEVHLATRGTPAARVVGSARATDAIDIRIEGRTMIVRAGVPSDGASSQVDGHDTPVVYLRTTDLRGASVVGGSKLDITGPVRAPRIDLQVTGSGTIAASALDAEQLVATLIGNGTMTLGGRAGHARLLANGGGTIDAASLQVGDLVLRLDGAGTTHASARYTADVLTSGSGAVTVDGNPKCKVQATAGGPVICGVAPVR